MNFKKYAEKTIELSILAVAFIVPVIFYTRTNDVFEINKIFVFKFFVLLAAALMVMLLATQKKITLARTDFDFPVLGYLAACFITTLVTRNHFLSVFGVYEDFEGIITMIFYIGLFYLTVNYIKSAAGVYKVMTVMLLATLLIAGYGLAQNFGWDFVMWNPETYSPERFFSTLGNPNFLAAYLVETIPIIAIMFFMTHKKLKKVAILTVLLMAVTVLFLTKSRAGFISFLSTVVLLAVYAIIDSRKQGNVLFSKNKTWFIMFGFLILGTLFIPKVQEGIFTIWERSKGLFTFHGITLTPRIYIWESALMMFRDYPVFGTGLDTFQVMFPYYRFPIYWQLEWNGTPEKTHNIFLQVLATQGLVGMGFYLLIFTAFIKKCYNMIFKDRDITTRYLVFGVFMAVIAYAVQGLFNYTVAAYGVVFWMALGMVASLDINSKKIMNLELPPAVTGVIRQYRGLTYSVIIAVFLILFGMLAREWSADMYFKIGNIATSSEKNDLSVPYYQRAVELNPNCEIYWVKYGIAYEKMLRGEQNPQKKMEYINSAMKIHERTIFMNPMNGYNFNNLARVYRNYGESLDPSKFQDAVKYYNEAIKRDPNNAYFGLDLASVYIALQQFDKAEEICKGYLVKYPNFAVPYSYMGYMKMLRGKEFAAQAQEYYVQAADNKQWFRDTATELSTYSNLAIIYFNQKKFQQAMEMFRKVVAVKPDYIEGYLNMGKLYELMGKFSDAVATYETAANINPADTRVTAALEQARKKAGR